MALSSKLPKYRRIADNLAAEISAGRFKAGDQIPSERDIAESFGTSRMTVRQALRHLADRDIIETRVGQGTFVGNGAIQQQLSTLTGFTEEMERQGRAAESIVVEAARRSAEPETSQALGIPAGADVWRISRIRLADGEPVALETTEVNADLAPDLLERADFSRASLYATLREHYDLHPATADQTLAAEPAEPSIALPLRLTVGSPVLRLNRITRDSNGRPFEHVKSFYRGDVFVMRTQLNLEGS